jgi:hypothetical protein
VPLTTRQTVNLMHLVNDRRDLSTARCDHDEGCARVGNEGAKCDCSQARSPSGADAPGETPCL